MQMVMELVYLQKATESTQHSRNGTRLTSCTSSIISNSAKTSWMTSKNKNRSIHTYIAAACTTAPLQRGDGAGVPSKSNRIHPAQQEWHMFDLLRE